MTDLPNPIIGYLIATHGVKKLTANHPAIRQQIANLRAWEIAKAGKVEIAFRSDYARTINGLKDLPTLQRLLNEGVGVLMDDLSRLFRPCHDVEAAKQFLIELEPHAEIIAGLRQRTTLGALNGRTKALMVSRQLHPRFVLAGSATARKHSTRSKAQTQAGNAASAKARGKAADEAAQPLQRLKSALEAGGQTVTLAKLAERANADGLRTRRGNLWRADTVSRALKRIST